MKKVNKSKEMKELQPQEIERNGKSLEMNKMENLEKHKKFYIIEN